MTCLYVHLQSLQNIILLFRSVKNAVVLNFLAPTKFLFLFKTTTKIKTNIYINPNVENSIFKTAQLF